MTAPAPTLTPPTFDAALLARPLRRGPEVERFNQLSRRQAELAPAESDEIYLLRLRRLTARERRLQLAIARGSEEELRDAIADHERRLTELRALEELRREAGLSAGYEGDADVVRRARELQSRLAAMRPRGLVAGIGQPGEADGQRVRLSEERFAPGNHDAPLYLLAPRSLAADALGKRRPSLRSWERIRGALGISEPLPEKAWRQQPREISDELVATLGACLAAVRSITLAELAAATGSSISDVRLALRRLAEQLEATGMQVLDGSHVQLAPERHFHDAVAQLVQPDRLSRLTQERAEVLAIVVMEGMATRRRIEKVRGAAQLSIGPEGPVSLPRDSSETLALLLSRGLLCAERDDHAAGRPLVYRPPPRLLQMLGAATLEEVKARMQMSADKRPFTLSRARLS